MFTVSQPLCFPCLYSLETRHPDVKLYRRWDKSFRLDIFCSSTPCTAPFIFDSSIKHRLWNSWTFKANGFYFHVKHGQYSQFTTANRKGTVKVWPWAATRSEKWTVDCCASTWHSHTLIPALSTSSNPQFDTRPQLLVWSRCQIMNVNTCSRKREGGRNKASPSITPM